MHEEARAQRTGEDAAASVEALMSGTLTISARVRIGEILALLIIFAVGATALVRTIIVARRVERFAGEQFPDTLLLAQIAQGRLEADRAANGVFALAGRSPELRGEVASEAEIALAAVDEGMKSYETRPRPLESLAEWVEVAAALQLWREAVERFLEVSRRSSDAGAPRDPGDDATLVAWQVARASSQDAEKALLSYMTRVAGAVQQVRQESTSSTRIALWLIGLALLAGASVHVVGGRWLRRSVGKTVATLVGEAKRLEEAVASGELDVRGVPGAVSVEFRPIVTGLNETLDAFVSRLRLTAGHIDRIARGEVPEKVSGECRGEFEVLRRNLNQCITELEDNRTRLAEAQKKLVMAERLSTIGSLAAGVAHEVNSPLSAVVADLGYLAEEVPALLEVAQRYPEDAALPERARELGEVLSDARAAAWRVAVTVRELAEVAGPNPTSAVRVSLPAVLETALILASNKLKKPIHVVREMGPVPPVMANEALLAQVFLHLLVNAAGARPSADGEIRVVTRPDGRGFAVVEVRHDGPSLDAFDDPRPAGAQVSLGLSVCEGIVLGLGGRLEMETEPGRGGFVRVILPPAPAEPCGVPPV